MDFKFLINGRNQFSKKYSQIFTKKKKYIYIYIYIL